MKKTVIGFALTGSFCTIDKALVQMEELVRRGYEVQPIFSFNIALLDTRFQTAQSIWERALEITGREPFTTLQQVEPIGPKRLTDAYVIAPATGNSLAKLANGIYDTPALLGAKSHLRNDRPLVLAVSTNDGLSTAAQNIGILLARRNVYFVPYTQDDPFHKPRSLVTEFSLLPKAVVSALSGIQLQPIFTPIPQYVLDSETSS
ncbi:MAG: dipicolinate synthase subunit B [Clostridiales bacterium]|nr:dipicolinate synthase subunit B [Clostridiales bacterium]